MVRAMRRFMLVVALVGCSGPKRPPPKAPDLVPPGPGSAPPAPNPKTPEPKAPDKLDPKMTWSPKTVTLAESGIVPGWLDKSADPCTDFFQYACGSFVKTAVIPADRASWGTIEILTRENEEFLRKELEADALAKSSDPVTQKLGDYFASCMDEATIDKVGAKPLEPILATIATVADAKTLYAAITALHVMSIKPFFEIGPQQDYADATQVIAGLDQSGLGLPDRDYYISSKGSMAKTLAVYRAHVERMFVLLGRPAKDAKQAAADVLRVETAIAKLEQSKVERRDPHKIYHRVERAGLEKTVAPTFPWGDYLAAMGIPNVTAISVTSPAYFTGMAKLLTTTQPAVLRSYLTWMVLRSSADELPRAWQEERLTMMKELRGVTELPPRWRNCTNHVDGDLGELLGQAYVKAKFTGDSKPRAVELTAAISAAMSETIDHLPWMDDATRGPAKEKLAKMASLIGYPDKWRNYTFAVARGDFFGNVQRANQFEQARQMAKIGKPVDRFEWLMTPPTVNAYYDPSLNEIALPAGQLQPPFFAATFHPAVNFGSMGGGTIGHEITHGFDDEGSQFDASGNLHDWWTKSTKDKFEAATKCVVEQYGNYEAVPKVKLDGKLTAGENIADIGGVKLGYTAYLAYKAQQAAKKQPVQTKIDDMTDDQVYYLSYGQSWCDKQTAAALETQAHSNPHSPPKWRVNGVIVNQPGFATAFGCKANTPMNPGKQCSVW
jgi:putative endopeptidase